MSKYERYYTEHWKYKLTIVNNYQFTYTMAIICVNFIVQRQRIQNYLEKNIFVLKKKKMRYSKAIKTSLSILKI